MTTRPRTETPTMTQPNGRPHQLVGYAVGHLLADDGPVEFYEEEAVGAVIVHPNAGTARAARDDDGADPGTWQVFELRIVPEPTGGA